MIRNWKLLALYSLLAATPTPQIIAQTPQVDPDDVYKLTRRVDQLELIRKDLKRLDQLDAVQLSLSRLDMLDLLQKELRTLMDRLQIVEERKVSIPNNNLEIEQLQRIIREMSERIIALEDRKVPTPVPTIVNATPPPPLADAPKYDRYVPAASQCDEVATMLRKLDISIHGLADRLLNFEERKIQVGATPNNNTNNDEIIRAIKNLDNNIKNIETNILNEIQGVKKDLSSLQAKQLDLRLETDRHKGRLDQLDQNIISINEELRALRKRLELIPTTVTQTPSMDRSFLDDIRVKLGSIEQAILRLQPSTTTTQNRSSFFVAPSTPTPTTSTGRVVLVNLYPEDMLFIINGKETRVGPQKTVPIDAIPAGTLTYEVWSTNWGRRAQNTTTLAANETFTITAR